MKIYFTAAIYQSNELGENYKRIIKALEDEGHTVVHYHTENMSMDFVKHQTEEERIAHYRETQKRITEADIVVAEASFPSTLNIGHEITLGLNKGKPVIVFYKEGRDSFFLHGLNSERLFLVEYSDKGLEDVVRDSLEYAKDQSDTRFNFFISPSLSHYLDWISQHMKIPRSVYLRRLIEEDRDQHPEYGS